MNTNTVDDFNVGDHVRYILTGEDGVITSKNLTYVFVSFSVFGGSSACNPNDLELVYRG